MTAQIIEFADYRRRKHPNAIEPNEYEDWQKYLLSQMLSDGIVDLRNIDQWPTVVSS